MKTIDELLACVKRIHFIGIGGAGMCPLAEILHSKGYSLSGSDNNESDTLARIRSLGIPVAMGQRAENIGDAEMVVYTAALLPDNEELCAAQNAGIPTFERSKLFGALSRHFENCIGICGTHGKTTVTSMTVQILMMAGIDPSAVIGGRLPLIKSNGRVGSGEVFVCEACEYKNTFLDLSPRCSVILNIDEDHLEFFKTMENLTASFTKFAAMSDTVIYNGDDANTLKALEPVSGKTMISFGEAPENEWQAANIKMHNGAFAHFDIVHRGETLGRVRLKVPGRHNALNALAAVAASDYAGADIAGCIAGLESFEGAGRRFETLYKHDGITVADDYAHHPAELKVTLNAAMSMGFKRVWAVFQPFTFSRTVMHFDEFVDVLSIPDRVILTEIMGSREINTYGIQSSQLAEKIPGSVLFDSFDAIADFLFENVASGDLVITLGCGDVYKIAKILIKKYEAR